MQILRQLFAWFATGQQSDLEKMAKMSIKEAEFRKTFEAKVVEEGLKLYICEDYIFEKNYCRSYRPISD